MKVGFASRIINPTESCFLAGYDAKRALTGVNDNIKVKALIFNNGERQICFLSFDLIAVDALIVEEIKKRSKYRYDLDFVIFATHTHSSVGGVIRTDDINSVVYCKDNVFGKKNSKYIEAIILKALVIIEQAYENQNEAELNYFKYQVSGIGANRNSKLAKGDQDVVILEIMQKNSKLLLVNYACHPTVLNHKNLKLSNDLYGAIENEFNVEYDFIMFMNGASGDLSTRFNRQLGSANELQRFAKIFKETWLMNQDKRKELTSNHLYFTEWQYIAKIKKPMTLIKAKHLWKLAERNLANAERATLNDQQIRQLEAKVEGAKANFEYSENYSNLVEYLLEGYYLKIGELSFVTYPGEIYSELTNQLKEKHDVSIIGYCNDYTLYLTDQNAFLANNYEALSSPFAEGEGEKLIHYLNEYIRRENGNN